MAACEECHKSKVKCSGSGRPCTRCISKGLECVERLSRQGKRPQSGSTSGNPKSKKQKGISSIKDEDDYNDDYDVDHDIAEEKSKGETIIANSELSMYGNQHCGINWLIRSWVAIAFRRRSFALLARASSLAQKCQISMDQILCGWSSPFWLADTAPKPMDYLSNVVVPLQQAQPGAFSWSEFPERLKSKICSHCDIDDTTYDQDSWILAIRFHQGCVSYFVSEKFEQDVASAENIKAVYTTNQREVVSLFLSKCGCACFHKAVSKQLQLYISSRSNPPLVTVNNQRLKVGSGFNNPSHSSVTTKSIIVPVTLTLGFQIVNEDEGVLCVVFKRDNQEEEKDATASSLSLLDHAPLLTSMEVPTSTLLSDASPFSDSSTAGTFDMIFGNDDDLL